MRFRPAPQCVIATKRNAVVQNLANSEHGHLAALALRAATARDNVHSIVSVLAEIISDDDQRAVPPSLREGEQE